MSQVPLLILSDLSISRLPGLVRKLKEDDWLRHCWGQLPHPMEFFLVHNSLLSYQQSCYREDCDLPVVPRSKTELVMHRAHAHPVGRHLRAQHTLEKLRDHFHWLGIVADSSASNARSASALLCAYPLWHH